MVDEVYEVVMVVLIDCWVGIWGWLDCEDCFVGCGFGWRMEGYFGFGIKRVWDDVFPLIFEDRSSLLLDNGRCPSPAIKRPGLLLPPNLNVEHFSTLGLKFEDPEAEDDF